MTTRVKKASYINNLTLSDSQKTKFRRSSLNLNTIQKVVNALKGIRGMRWNAGLNQTWVRSDSVVLHVVDEMIQWGTRNAAAAIEGLNVPWGRERRGFRAG